MKVDRVGEQSVLEVVESTTEYLDEVQTHFPEGIVSTVWRDSSQGLRDRLSLMMRNGASGFALVFIVLALFLRTVELQPRHRKALSNAGSIYFERGEFEQAEVHYRAALGIARGGLELRTCRDA